MLVNNHPLTGGTVGDRVKIGAVGAGVATEELEEIPPLPTVAGVGVENGAWTGAGVAFGWATRAEGLGVGTGTGAGVSGKSQSMSPPSSYSSGTQHGQSGKGTCQTWNRGDEGILL